jgi:putative ABC transport system permease protein
MNLLDMAELGFENLRRTKLRTTLTILGVVIGIGALTSMVSFGTGMQKNITDAFRKSDLFTSLFVTAREINIEEVMGGSPHEIATALTRQPEVSLSDSTLELIGDLAEVEIAFPEIAFPVKVRIGEGETKTTLQALPSAMGSYSPFNDLLAGEFFADDTVASAVIRWETLKAMDILISAPEGRAETSGADSAGVTRVVAPDSIIGKPLQVITAVLDISEVRMDPMRAMLQSGRSPFAESVSEFKICGILKRQSTFAERKFRGGVIVPMKAGQRIPRLGFSSVWDLLGRGAEHDGYEMVYVRVKEIGQTESVRDTLESMGLNVISISDQLKEIRKGFLIVDSILGAVGTIALVVAALGIVNTMVMSILERTREIGVMKAIGGSEQEIRTIFFVEAATIGVIGAIFGLILGWLVTRVANLVVNSRLMPAGEAPINLFYFPIWLILGAVGFSIVVSLIAGLYPASRAARVDPVTALRHD